MSSKSLTGDSSEIDDSSRSFVFWAHYFASRGTPSSFQRLRPALYLAQCKTRYAFYDYHLSRGHVVSGEFANEVAQLLAIGTLRVVDHESISVGEGFKEVSNFRFAEDLEQLKVELDRLLGEELEALEAAATSEFFRTEGIGDPSRLEWFRTLPPNVSKRATELAQDTKAR
jgi:hypothetical protein